MIIGVAKEVKVEEYRVALTPDSVADLTRAGHTVLIERKAGVGSAYEDAEYRSAGAGIAADAAEIYARADLICGVKEPQPSEYELLREGQVLFTYLHLAAEPAVTEALLRARCIAIGYESVRRDDGSLPLLAPMSEIAGRMALEVAQQFLKKPGPGRGQLLGSVTGVPAARVVVIGSGTVGRNTCQAAVGAGARVTVLSIAEEQLRAIEAEYGGRVETVLSSPSAVARAAADADVLVGAVLVEGQRAPVVVTREMVRSMRPGSVIVDVAVDQGGCVETTRATTHSDPVYVEEGVVHYAVANMPGAVPRTASRALSALTLPYILKIANEGCERALRQDQPLWRGVNTYQGQITHQGVAQSLGREWAALETLLPKGG